MALSRRGLTIVDVAADACIQANAPALGIVLSNLVDNALRHTEDGEIRVAYRDGTLSVDDTGSGIAADDLVRAGRMADHLDVCVELIRPEPGHGLEAPVAARALAAPARLLDGMRRIEDHRRADFPRHDRQCAHVRDQRVVAE